MKKHLQLYFLAILVLQMACLDGLAADRIRISTHVRRSGETNEWWIPVAELIQMPKWDPNKNEPPVSLSGAIKLAHDWVSAKRGGQEVEPESIWIRAVDPEKPQWRGVYYYRIQFEVAPFDSMVCIVLMNGAVLEPESKR